MLYIYIYISNPFFNLIVHTIISAAYALFFFFFSCCCFCLSHLFIFLLSLFSRRSFLLFVLDSVYFFSCCSKRTWLKRRSKMLSQTCRVFCWVSQRQNFCSLLSHKLRWGSALLLQVQTQVFALNV